MSISYLCKSAFYAVLHKGVTLKEMMQLLQKSKGFVTNSFINTKSEAIKGQISLKTYFLGAVIPAWKCSIILSPITRMLSNICTIPKNVPIGGSSILIQANCTRYITWDIFLSFLPYKNEFPLSWFYAESLLASENRAGSVTSETLPFWPGTLTWVVEGEEA